jgi:uncharacterized membrane protein HdeD (DUF308 family)
MTPMTAPDMRAAALGFWFSPPRWVRLLLGLVLLLAGMVILGDVVLAAIVSAFLVGAIAIAAGLFEIGYAVWTKGWGGFGWQLLLGALYVICGVVLITQPVLGAMALTFALGLALAISGFLRIAIAVDHWRDKGWIILLSGVFGVVAGLIILTGFPRTSLWVLGLLLGVDLVWHGLAWFTYNWLPAFRSA